MASGLCAALTGRTHGCTDQPANVKKTLANSEPSTHGTKRTNQVSRSRAVRYACRIPIPSKRSNAKEESCRSQLVT